MISSAIAFIYTPGDNNALNQNSIDYKGFNFQLTTDNRYVININGNNIIFDNNPSALEDINIPDFQITQDKIYLIFSAISLSSKNLFNSFSGSFLYIFSKDIAFPFGSLTDLTAYLYFLHLTFLVLKYIVLVIPTYL